MAVRVRRFADPHPTATFPPVPLATKHRLRAVATACALAAITGIVPAGSAQAADLPQTPEPQAPATQTQAAAPETAAQSAVCPESTAPPPPEDTSEVPKPGEPNPPPLPVPPSPVGGPRMGACGEVLPQGAPSPPPQVQVAGWTLADLDTGNVLAAKDPHARERPASCIKVLTSLVAIKSLKMTDTITATQQDADQEGSKVGLAPGITYTVQQVLTGMLMRSGNDAAHALAMRLGGERAMVDRMNALADEIGAHDTRTATPAGLDGPGMSASAYDLALIFRQAMLHPEFAQAIGTRTITLPGPLGKPPLTVESDNDVLKKYPGALGGKSGFTDDARHTFIAAAQRGPRRLVAVLMRGENKPPNHQYDQAMRLLDYGFGLGTTPPVGELGRRPAPPPPAPREEAGTRPASSPSQDGLLGTVAAPVGLVIIAAGAVAVVLVQRRRRARTAGGKSDEHP